jgi:hypothetical protein
MTVGLADGRGGEVSVRGAGAGVAGSVSLFSGVAGLEGVSSGVDTEGGVAGGFGAGAAGRGDGAGAGAAVGADWQANVTIKSTRMSPANAP